MKTDALIIGSGIAGLAFAIKLAEAFPDSRIALVTKKGLLESNTSLAQGGIAIPLDEGDDVETHVRDTLRAGDGLCEESIVRMVIGDAPERFRELRGWGIDFDRDPSGKLALGKEGGHSVHRIVHHKDTTGNHVAEGLLAKAKTFPNIRLMPDHFAVDLLIRRDRKSGERVCVGAIVIDLAANRVRTITSRVTLLATGGVGQIYQTTTNPLVATGDGVAMAWRAGAAIRDMEFIQFHPTAFYSTTDNPSFLISEAVRGFGAHLRSSDGDRFALRYDPRGELAPRDVVSKAIHHEMMRNGDGAVLLDCTHLPADDLRNHFPFIVEQCSKRGYDMTRVAVPVAPAAHYLCGGVVADENGRTSVPRLYACGECVRTGLHGANRLASNSLLEALVFAHRAFLDVSGKFLSIDKPGYVPVEIPRITVEDRDEWIHQQRQALRVLMSRNAGIVRSNDMLREAGDVIALLHAQVAELYSVSLPTTALCELRNMVDVASLVVRDARARTENKGTCFNLDLAV